MNQNPSEIAKNFKSKVENGKIVFEIAKKSLKNPYKILQKFQETSNRRCKMLKLSNIYENSSKPFRNPWKFQIKACKCKICLRNCQKIPQNPWKSHKNPCKWLNPSKKCQNRLGNCKKSLKILQNPSKNPENFKSKLVNVKFVLEIAKKSLKILENPTKILVND